MATVHHLTPEPPEPAERYWPESEVWRLVEAVRRYYEGQPSATVLTLVRPS